MLKMIFAFICSVYTVCICQVSPGAVVQFDNEMLIYIGYFVSDSKTCAIIENYYSNNYWCYAEGDTIFMGSATAKLENIDTVKNQVILKGISFKPKAPESNYGLYQNSSVLLHRYSINLDSANSEYASFTIFKMENHKVFVYENDTIVINGIDVSLIHIFEESIPVVNCRNILVKDTMFSMRGCAFYYHGECYNAPFWLRGYISKKTFRVYIEYDDEDDVVEYFNYTNAMDSISLKVKCGNNVKIDNENTIYLDWVYNKGFQALAGFRFFAEQKTSNLKVEKLNTKKAVNRESGFYTNLLGQTIKPGNSAGSAIIKKDVEIKF